MGNNEQGSLVPLAVAKPQEVRGCWGCIRHPALPELGSAATPGEGTVPADILPAAL